MSTDITLLSDGASRFDDKFDLIVKHWRDRRPDDHPDRVKLPVDLQKQLSYWIKIQSLLATGRYPKTVQQLNAILKAFPEISPRTARNYLADTKRFFGTVDEPDLAYKRVMLIEELEDDMRLSKKKGDLKALASFRKLYKEVIGADKPEEKIENKTIINILNYNPEQLGGRQVSDDALVRMVEGFLAEDKQKQEKYFDDYEDVQATENPA